MLSSSNNLPDGLIARWRLTDTALVSDDALIVIPLETNPPPRCFDAARQYEAARKEAAVRRITLAQRKPTKKRPPPPKEQTSLWDE